MRYAWIITRDFHPLPDAARGTYCNAPGVAGPGGATDEEIALAKDGYLFRLLDGDGNVSYHGRLWAEDADNPKAIPSRYSEGWLTYGPTGDEQSAFGPLWDFGTPNAGCTEIQYRCLHPEDPTKKVWASL